MRAVVDTNVLISGLFWRGSPQSRIRYARSGDLTMVSSPALLAEVSGVIARMKFRSILARADTTAEQILAELSRMVEVIDPPPLPAPVARDSDDDAVLALAVASRVDFIISGDADLLTLGAFAGIPILGPTAALAIIAA